MRIVRHSSYIKKQKSKSKWLAVVGFVILSSAMFLAMIDGFLLIAYVAMIGGFILFNMGMQGVGRWTRNPRNDEILDARMKGLTDQVTIVHYASLEVDGKSREIDHLVVHNGGLLLLNGKEIDGQIRQKKSAWTKQGGLVRRFFGFSGPQLGNPSFENDRNVPVVEKWLAENQLEVDVMAATVFLHPKAELEIVEPDYPVLHAEELEEFLRDLPADPTFTTDEKKHLIDLLSAGEGVEQPEKQQVNRRPRPTKRVSAPKPSQVKRNSA
ncbi:MAG: NERD domain-containing protein [Thermomicrobiales bacterium]|nr:NERD domain-containing protein [Thermomicrobiales bacterium]